MKFTPWGILSGVFWVPGATCGIYGIKNAGLAIAVGTWSSLIVISSFSWGIFVFHEEVKSITGACGGALVFIIGLIGMGRYASPRKVVRLKEVSDKIDGFELSPRGGIDAETKRIAKRRTVGSNQNESKTHNTVSDTISVRQDVIGHTSISLLSLSDKELLLQHAKYKDVVDATIEKESDIVLSVGGFTFSRCQLGIIGAIINGTWGGMAMVPMYYARVQGCFGAGYLISYACGSFIVTILMWIIRYLYNLYQTNGKYKDAYKNLPSFHLRQMWFCGLLSGFLYSLGNFCSIITVTILGQGVGYSLVQTSMLISGLWGIFYFGEVNDTERKMKWIFSSVITIVGILWLSYEHQGSPLH